MLTLISSYFLFFFVGSHCLDILTKKPTDPEWLTMQRNTEVKIMEGWITKYYADLKALKNGNMH